MPSINLDLLELLGVIIKDYINFIETGTYMGETILNMEPHFEHLYTVEVNKLYYENIKKKYNGHKIKFYLGDSGVVLDKLLAEVEGKSIIFLDGHWSGGDTGKGKKDCPLYEELMHIMKHHKAEAVIIIDDVRLFGKGPKYGNCKENWQDINIDNILKMVSESKKHYFLHSELNEKDRLVIHIDKS